MNKWVFVLYIMYVFTSYLLHLLIHLFQDVLYYYVQVSDKNKNLNCDFRCGGIHVNVRKMRKERDT